MLLEFRKKYGFRGYEVLLFSFFLALSLVTLFSQDIGGKWLVKINNKVLSVLVALDQPKEFQFTSSELIAFDENSLRNLGYPLSREYYSRSLNSLQKSGPRTVVFDVLFGASPDLKKTWDFASQLEKIESPVFSAVSSREWFPSLDLLNEISPKYFLPIQSGYEVALETSFPPLLSKKSSIGISDLYLEDDGQVLWYPLVHSFNNQWLPSLALSAFLNKTQSEFEVIAKDKNLDLIQGIKITNSLRSLFIKTDLDPLARGRVLLLPKAKSELIAHRAMYSTVQEQFNSDEAKVIFYGSTVRGLSNVVRSPVDSLQNGTHVHMFALEQLTTNDLKFQAPGAKTIVLTIAIVLLGIPLFLRLRHWLAPLFFISFSFFMYVFLILGFWYSGYSFNYAAGFLALGCSWLLVVFRYNSTQLRSARKMKKSFESYLHPRLVARVAENDSVLELDGEDRKITILFCDLRNFTSLSEKISAHELVKVLNQYFEVAVRNIQEQEGTVDKFIGDAVMAFWNAPLEIELQQVKSVTAALKLLDEFDEFAKELKLRLDMQVAPSMGVGIHFGSAIVGNVGVSTRLSYTAIGDSVNIGSRLESLSKEYNTQILISSEVASAIPSKFLSYFCLELDSVQLKGKEEPITIFTFVKNVSLENLERWATFLSAYRSGDVVKCAELALGMENTFPWIKEFVSRFDTIKKMNSNWRGVWRFDKK